MLDENPLIKAQYIVIPRFDPSEYMLEILQVVKRIFYGIGDHRQSGPLALSTGWAYR